MRLQEFEEMIFCISSSIFTITGPSGMIRTKIVDNPARQLTSIYYENFSSIRL